MKLKRLYGKKPLEAVNANWRLIWAVVVFWGQFPLVSLIAPGFSRSHAPVHQNISGMLIHVSCTVFAVVVLIPVVRHGKQWQKLATLFILLSFGLIPILVSILMNL
ncbi:MAG: hypothetical protein M2R45_04714 [Verrucomicrobia subdivision 3 bacterium]|nr:hypothetical protein [Limisphaerales bacterium]MCS1416263.1 hypothetical protein [Limisphaerales bacterium]